MRQVQIKQHIEQRQASKENTYILSLKIGTIAIIQYSAEVYPYICVSLIDRHCRVT